MIHHKNVTNYLTLRSLPLEKSSPVLSPTLIADPVDWIRSSRFKFRNGYSQLEMAGGEPFMRHCSVAPAMPPRIFAPLRRLGLSDSIYTIPILLPRCHMNL